MQLTSFALFSRAQAPTRKAPIATRVVAAVSVARQRRALSQLWKLPSAQKF